VHTIKLLKIQTGIDLEIISEYINFNQDETLNQFNRRILYKLFLLHPFFSMKFLFLKDIIILMMK
jgi:hypothetical protein